MTSDKTQASDEELMLRAQRGEQDAFVILVKRYHTDIIGFANSYLRDAELARDVGQQVFMEAFRNRAGFKPSSKFRTWIFTICRYRCLDIKKSSSWKERRSAAPDPAALESLPNADAPPQAILENEEVQALLEHAMSQISEEERQLVYLMFYQNATLAEAADILGTTIDKVRGRLAKVTQKIRGHLHNLM